jgi:hypothetical protein
MEGLGAWLGGRGHGTQCLVNMDNWRLYFEIVFYDY